MGIKSHWREILYTLHSSGLCSKDIEIKRWKANIEVKSPKIRILHGKILLLICYRPSSLVVLFLQ